MRIDTSLVRPVVRVPCDFHIHTNNAAPECLNTAALQLQSNGLVLCVAHIGHALLLCDEPAMTVYRIRHAG